jgi:TolA-binding protein
MIRSGHQTSLAVLLGLWAAALAMPVFAQAPKKPAAPAAAPAPVSLEGLTAARKSYEAGAWAEALAAFQKFERENKFSTALPESIYYQGWCWFNLARYAEALAVFDRLLKNYPDSVLVPEVLLKRAECQRELKNFSAAAAIYREFSQRFPQHELLPQAILGEAWMLFKNKDLAGAKAKVQLVRERFKSQPDVTLDALFLLGQLLTEEKKFDEARAVYKLIASQRANPRATEGLYLAGEAMYDSRRYQDAINYYKRVQPTAALLDNIQTEMNQLLAERPGLLAQGSAGLVVLQSRMEALKQLAVQIKARPDLRASALFRIANCYQSLERPEEASVVYRYLLQKYPDDKVAPQANFGLIQTLTQRGQLEQANAETELFKKKYPASPLLENAQLVQAEALFGQSQFKDALPLYQKALAVSKDAQTSETIEFRIAACAYGLEQFDKARDAFLAFVRKYPATKITPEALFRLGRSYYEIANRSNDPKIAQPNLVDAIKTYEDIRAKFPQTERLPEVTFQLGYLYSYLGAYDKTSYEKAIGTFQDFSKRWPDNRLVAEASYQIARNYLSMQRFDDAVAAYKQVVDRFPDNSLAPFAAFETGSTYATAKKPNEMIEALRAYVSRYPDHARVADALYAIAAELENQKKPDEAIATYREIVARGAATVNNLTDDQRNSILGAELRIISLLEQKGDLQATVMECQAFLAKFSADALAARTTVSQIAGLYRKAKRLPDGYAVLDQLTSQYQANAAIRLATATSTIELALGDKDYTRANAAAQKLLADPEHDRLPAVSLLAGGNTFLKTENYARAAELFGRAGTTPLALLGLGQAQLGLKNYDQAESAFNKVVAADPQNLEAKLGLGKVYESQGRVKDAVAAYDPVWRQGRGDAATEAAFRVGMLAIQQKDYKAALPMFARLLFATGPMAEEAAFRAAQCHEALGNTPQACSAFQAYAKRFPAGKFVDDAKSQAAKLCAVKQE